MLVKIIKFVFQFGIMPVIMLAFAAICYFIPLHIIGSFLGCDVTPDSFSPELPTILCVVYLFLAILFGWRLKRKKLAKLEEAKEDRKEIKLINKDNLGRLFILKLASIMTVISLILAIVFYFIPANDTLSFLSLFISKPPSTPSNLSNNPVETAEIMSMLFLIVAILSGSSCYVYWNSIKEK